MGNFFSYISDYDICILRLIHNNRIASFDSVLYVISFSTTYISAAILVSILLVSIKSKSVELKNKFLKVLCVFIFASVISLTLKSLIFRERPFLTFTDITQLSEAGSSSFPSGHTIEAFAMALSFIMLFPQWRFIIPAAIWALLVAYSRMALGVHYPIDVFSGMLIGILISYGTIRAFKIEKIESFISKRNLWK